MTRKHRQKTAFDLKMIFVDSCWSLLGVEAPIAILNRTIETIITRLAIEFDTHFMLGQSYQYFSVADADYRSYENLGLIFVVIYY